MAETARAMARTSPARTFAAQFSSVAVMRGRLPTSTWNWGVYPEWLIAARIFDGWNRGGGPAGCTGGSGLAARVFVVGFDDALDEVVTDDIPFVEIDE